MLKLPGFIFKLFYIKAWIYGIVLYLCNVIIKSIAMNMHNYNFILNNLELLSTDGITIFNLTTLFPDRKIFAIIENQRLINLRRQILADVSENRHNLIYFTVPQWDMIKRYVNHENRGTNMLDND